MTECTHCSWEYQQTIMEQASPSGTGMLEMAIVICQTCGRVRKVEVERA